MNDFLRNLFGIRQKRSLPPVTASPPIGASIVRQGVKIKISHPCSDELWEWLLLSGWRVNPVRNDRRKGLVLPRDAIRLLSAAKVDERGKVLETLLAIAREGA